MMAPPYMQQMHGVNMVRPTGVNGPLPGAVEKGAGEVAMAAANIPNNMNNRFVVITDTALT